MRKSRIGILQVKAEEPKKKVERSYENIVQAREMYIADGVKLVFSVSKTSDGEPHLDIRTHIESEKYTGPTKKGINLDIEYLEDLKVILDEIDQDLQKKGL